MSLGGLRPWGVAFGGLVGGMGFTHPAGMDAILQSRLGALPPGFDYPRLTLTPGQYAALLAFIAETRRGAAVSGAGFSDTDAFFEARGRFHLFRTCNTWITDALRAAGHPAGAWTPTPYSVRLSLWWHGG